MELRLLQNFDDIEKNEWNSLLAESITHVPFLRYEYLKTWWETRGGGEWPQDARLAIIAAHEGAQLVGIAPLFYTEWEGQPSLLLLGSIEISDYLDLIARPADLNHFILASLDFLSRPGNGLPSWRRLDLYNVIENSPTLPALEEAARDCGLRYHSEPFRPSLTIDLPGDWEAYLAGIDKKQRHEIRRKMRRAMSDEVPLRWYASQDPNKIDADIEEFLRLMAMDHEKAAFLSPAMRENFRKTTRCAFDEGCLLLSFLELDGQKIAAYLNFNYLDQLWVYNSGMDFDFMQYSPGWVLLGELLKWANENGIKKFDFMRGDEDYKFRFGATRREVMRVTLERKA